MALLRTRLAAASEGAGPLTDEAPAATALDTPFAAGPRAAPLARAFHAVRAATPSPDTGMSMADTLDNAFGVGGDRATAAPGFVHTAYSRLQALGL